MSTESPLPKNPRPSLLKNWLSMTGVVIIIGSAFSFFLLFAMDVLARTPNPYLGILTYFVAPAFFFLGLTLTIIGALWERRKLGHTVGTLLPRMVVDLSRPRDRKIMGIFLVCTVLFLLVSAMGSYHTYHFTESTTFCGEACHTVMEPEMVTYQHGSHARVSCTECHIGKGASYFVKSKLSGTYQLYAVAFNKYPRPIPTPIKNLRPAQDTCEQCHWPEKFVGDLDRTYNYFLGDEANTPYSLRMTMKVGGADPTRGPVGGIHWHMNVGNKVEYLASDPSRTVIPWVRMTDGLGVVTVFTAPGFTNEVDASAIRTMDCMDCHNRPAHRYMSPNQAVNLAMSLGQIDPQIPSIKANAVEVLTREYSSNTEAEEGIATTLSQLYPDDQRIRQVITEVQSIYRKNFFPEMKADWRAYPDHIGHQQWPGCFRCHDGEHRTADATRTIKANDCNSCHTILAQGSGEELMQLTPQGQPFKHPGDEVEGLCTDCHDGTF
ncbi:MAG: cytochrome c3 family protein [Verrucomicrobia bacterium]|nr:cytochrome c3 family protein [Verrucomicrobiota bacterium]